jgi:hypothetical protein
MLQMSAIHLTVASAESQQTVEDHEALTRRVAVEGLQGRVIGKFGADISQSPVFHELSGISILMLAYCPVRSAAHG